MSFDFIDSREGFPVDGFGVDGGYEGYTEFLDSIESEEFDDDDYEYFDDEGDFADHDVYDDFAGFGYDYEDM